FGKNRLRRNRMPRFLSFALSTAIAGIGLIQPSAAQESANAGRLDLRLSVVGVGAQNYAEALKFYTSVMGFRPAFSFSPNGKTTFTYLQLSRDTFMELQET